MRHTPPIATLFPYTTLFRSSPCVGRHLERTLQLARFGIERVQAAARREPDSSAVERHAVNVIGTREGAVLANDLCRASGDRKSTRLNSSHSQISYAVFRLKK